MTKVAINGFGRIGRLAFQKLQLTVLAVSVASLSVRCSRLKVMK